MPHSTLDRSRKRAKFQPLSSEHTFMNAQDICQALRNTNLDVLSTALLALRSKLSVRLDEALSPQDERLQLVKAWLEVSPGAQDIFDAWERVNQLSTIAVLVTALSSTLLLLSSHFPYHPLGLPIINTLLSTQWIRRLTTYLGGSQNDLILATLKLFNAISAFGSGRERKAVFDAFPWDNKVLPKLLYMRRRGKDNDAGSILSKPDIRTLYLLFILSFVDRETLSSVKGPFLEQRREAFVAIFKGLYQDPYLVIQKVLQVCWEGLWLDQKIKRTLKIGIFGEATISHLAKLYDRAVPESEGGSHVPADVVHHFLLAICSRPGQGICFKDHGWYPRETDEINPVEEDDLAQRKGRVLGKVYNKILSRVLPTLKVNEDARQQELVLKILLACPELVTGYWPTAALTLGPRLSTKWIANVSFAGRVLSQPVPTSSFLLPGTTEYNPTPPPLSTIMANIFPGVGTKVYFTKGLQAGAAPLMQHCTALTLAKCLMKMGEVVHVFKSICTALEEDEEGGQWTQRRKEVEKEARRRVPEFQVIVAFSQQHLSPQGPQNATKHALLSESSQRLLWLYQECLPDVVAEARFEVGKLVLTLAEDSLLSEHAMHDTQGRDQGRSPLQIVKQLHVLRLLSTSDQFTWSGKIASSSRTYFQVLMKTFCNTGVPALHTTLRTLLRHVLTESVLFQEDPDEVDLWLASLPSGYVRRGPTTEAPDGAPLTDEVDSVVIFLDDCTQRCLKTPYRYMEAKADLFQPDDNDKQSANAISVETRVEVFSSPLLMTVLEQLLAKVNVRLMSPSDTLSAFTFVRQLIVKLASKQADVGYRALHAFIQKLEVPVKSDGFFSDYPSIRYAIRRELSIAEACLGHLRVHSPSTIQRRSNDAVQAFLGRIEKVPVPEAEDARMDSAYELVDWLRLADVTPTPADITHLASVIRRLHHPTLKAFLQFLHPSQDQLWGSGILDFLEELRAEIDFELLFLHCSEVHLADVRCRSKLLHALLSRRASSLEVARAIHLVLHRVIISQDRPRLTQDLLLLLSDLFDGAKTSLREEDVQGLKTALVQSSLFYPLCLSTDLVPEVHGALEALVRVAFDPTNANDRKLFTPVTTYWMSTLKQILLNGCYDELRFVKPWVRFMESPVLLAAIDIVGGLHQQVGASCDILEEMLFAFNQMQSANHTDAVELPLGRLLGFQTQLSQSSLLEDMIAVCMASQLPVCHDALPPPSLSFAMITTLHLPRGGHLTSVPPDLISRYLAKEIWSDSAAKIIAMLLYAHVASSPAFASWLGSGQWEQCSIDHIAMTFAAFLDCSQSVADDLTQIDQEVVTKILERLFSEWPALGEKRLSRLQCICYVLQRYGQRRPYLPAVVEQKFQALPVENFAFETLHVAHYALRVTACETLAGGLLDRALRWAVRHFSNVDGHDDDSVTALGILRHISRGNFKFKPHLVEPVMAAIIKNRLHDPAAVEVAVSLVQNAELKPVVTNRLLQSVLHHEGFFRILGNDGTSLQKNEVTSLLDVLFHLHPTQTCHPSHIELLVQAYGGTLSPSDRRLLSIMRLFEAEKRTSVSPFFSRWSPSLDASVTNILEVMQNLDPIKMLRTCLFFPTWRRLSDAESARDGPNDEHMYDPLLIIALSAQMFVECPPTTALGWVKVFRTNVVSLLIRCLSSKDANMRETGACQLALVWDSIQKSDMQEKSQALYVLRLLKNTMHTTPNLSPHRLPTYSTLILLHALRGIFYPSNFIYSRTARFLLQRPELDIGDVPMLFSMLYSSSDEWKKERGWIVKMLADGMVSTADWKLLKRRHTWDLLASLFQGSQKDKTLCAGILEILANLTCNPQACTSLILKSALLSWIEMQLTNGSNGATIAWLKILENIAVVADVSKLQRAMGDEWFATICRSLVCILRIHGDNDIGTLSQIAALVSRLSMTRDVPKHYLQPVLGHAITYLKQVEPHVQFSGHPGTVPDSLRELASPPHYAQGLHTIPTITNSFHAWGKIVEGFWRVSMALDHRTSAWDNLTNRLLIWRGIVGEDDSPVGEWARKETINITF
ncbi:ribosome 60S biogenesis N-terminal-domain-containing protein [Scleroderma citrinum]